MLFNPGAEAMLGYVADEVIGQPAGHVPSAEELRRQATRLRALPNFSDICRASVAAGERNQLWRFRRKDGEERTMRMTLTAVPGERGELTGYLATAEDVTEREDAQRALLLTLEHQRTAVERLRELERVKGDFVSTVSHELRTPITSIIGYTELLDDGEVGELTFSQQEIVDRVDRNGRRLLLLVEDLLTLSQIEAAALKIEPVVTDVRAVVNNAHGRLAPALVARSLDVSVLVPTQPVVHHGDPVQLERMLVNLLTNAVKFTPDGGRVELQLRTLSEKTEIVVSDTGHGHPRGRAVEAVHALLPVLHRDRAGHPGHRPGPDHRQGDRRPARRPDRRRVRAPARHHRHGEPAPHAASRPTPPSRATG